MTCQQVLTELKGYSNKQIENIFDNHGAKGQSWGVKVQDLKKIQKKVKKDHALSLELFDTGISDAQYLAGLIADEKKITKKRPATLGRYRRLGYDKRIYRSLDSC